MIPLLGHQIQVIQALNPSQVGLKGMVVYQCPNLDLLILTQTGVKRIGRAVLNLGGSLVSTGRRNITHGKRVGRLNFTTI